MDMQNVSNLVIPEGEVRTIHDKDNRLIWGRLSYDTRYMGNTIQDGTPTPSTPVDIDVVTGEQTVTVTGKNLLGYDYASLKSSNSGSGRTWDDATKSVVYNGVTYELNDDGSITANGTASGASYLILVNSLPLTVGDSYILNGCPSGGSTSTYSIRLYNGGNYTTDSGNGVNFTYGTQGIVRINVSNGTVVNNIIFKPMIRNSSDTNTTYEPHQSQSYTVDLGSIELCKIGTYQDYIYKSGGDWYVHKEIGKSIFNGSEAWVQHAYVINNINGFRLNVGAANSDGGVFANYFRSVAWMSYQASGANGRTYGTITTASPDSSADVNIYITQPDSSVSTLAQFQTWLSTHNTTAYYAIATPTDTQITDSTLTSQLNAIHQFLTRYGYNATVTGNLPMIIDKTNL